MTLFECVEELESRLTPVMRKDYEKDIPEYFQALELALKCVEKQMELLDFINDFEANFNVNNRYSELAVDEMITQFSIYEEKFSK